MSDILKHKGIRATPFRNRVIEIFEENEYAITLQQIEDSLKDFDRITLYRTLKTFNEKGVIHEIVMPGDVKKMALCEHSCGHDHHNHQHEHIHFKCTKCEEIFCIDYNLPEINIDGFVFKSLEVQGKGYCASCS